MSKWSSNSRLKVLAFVIAIFLWFVAHLSSSAHMERPFDVPVVLTGLPTELIASSRNVDKVNLTVAGPRSAVRKIASDKLEYVIDVSKAQPGEARFDVDLSQLEMPRGTRIIGRSTAQIMVQFDKRKNKIVPVQVEQTGTLAPHRKIARIEIFPTDVELTGPEREIKRLTSVLTEPIDVSALTGFVETQVRVVLPGKNIQLVTDAPVTVKLWIERKDAATDVPGAANPQRSAGK